MAKIQADPEAIRQIKSDLNKTVKELHETAGKINSARNSSGEWNDAQGEQYLYLMSRIARAILSPVETLNKAQLQLDKLERTLDDYNRKKFS